MNSPREPVHFLVPIRRKFNKGTGVQFVGREKEVEQTNAALAGGRQVLVLDNIANLTAQKIDFIQYLVKSCQELS